MTVALYELLTGEKPFKGGEGIGTLLFQIANDPHPDPRTVRADLPPCAASVINKGLAKDADQRYARGSLLAADLRACIAAIKSGTATVEITQPAAVEPVLVLPDPAPEPTPVVPEPAAPEPVALERASLLPDPVPEPTPVVPEPAASPEATLVIPPAPAAPEPVALERVPTLPDPTPEPAAGLELGTKSPFGAPASPAPVVPASDKTVRLPPVRSGEFPDPATLEAASPPPAVSPDATIRIAPPSGEEKKP